MDNIDSLILRCFLLLCLLTKQINCARRDGIIKFGTTVGPGFVRQEGTSAVIIYTFSPLEKRVFPKECWSVRKATSSHSTPAAAAADASPTQVTPAAPSSSTTRRRSAPQGTDSPVLPANCAGATRI